MLIEDNNENIKNNNKGRGRSSALSNISFINFDYNNNTNFPTKLVSNNYRRSFEPGTINDEFFTLKSKIFPGLKDSEIAERAKKAQLLSKNPNIEPNLELLFKDVSIMNILNEYSIKKFYPTPERFATALRNYIIYGQDWVDHNNFLERYFANQNNSKSIVISTSMNYVPDDKKNSALIINYNKNFPYMKRTIFLKRDKELLKDPFFIKLLSSGIISKSPDIALFMSKTFKYRIPKSYQTMRLVAKRAIPRNYRGGKRYTRRINKK